MAIPTPSLSLSEGFSTIKSRGSMKAGEGDFAFGVRGQEADRPLQCLQLPVSTLHQIDMFSAVVHLRSVVSTWLSKAGPVTSSCFAPSPLKICSVLAMLLSMRTEMNIDTNITDIKINET